MELNYLDNWDDDWENNDTPEFFINLQETIKNRERELKLLEERRLVEESDQSLADDLFNNTDKEKISINQSIPVVPIRIKKEKPKDIKLIQEKKKHELEQKQRQQSQNLKEKKQLANRIKDTFGESDMDKYYEKYGYIEDKY